MSEMVLCVSVGRAEYAQERFSYLGNYNISSSVEENSPQGPSNTLTQFTAIAMC